MSEVDWDWDAVHAFRDKVEERVLGGQPVFVEDVGGTPMLYVGDEEGSFMGVALTKALIRRLQVDLVGAYGRLDGRAR
jgi:hypothetical protein